MMDLKDKLYAKMCANCPKEKHCHDECEFCDDFIDNLEALKSGETKLDEIH